MRRARQKRERHHSGISKSPSGKERPMPKAGSDAPYESTANHHIGFTILVKLLAALASFEMWLTERLSFQNLDVESVTHGVKALVLGAFHSWFRFFPPLMLLRWWIDLALFFTELSLALVKDFVRLGPQKVSVEDPPNLNMEVMLSRPSQSSPRGPGAEESQESQEAADRRKHAWISLFAYLMKLIYFMSKMTAIYTITPILSVQYHVLDTCSVTMHHLSGLDLKKQGKIVNEHALERRIIGSKTVPLNMTKRKWLTDMCLERAAHSMGNLPLGQAVLDFLDVKRPVRICRDFQKDLLQSTQDDPDLDDVDKYLRFHKVPMPADEHGSESTDSSDESSEHAANPPLAAIPETGGEENEAVDESNSMARDRPARVSSNDVENHAQE